VGDRGFVPGCRRGMETGQASATGLLGPVSSTHGKSWLRGGRAPIARCLELLSEKIFACVRGISSLKRQRRERIRVAKAPWNSSCRRGNRKRIHGGVSWCSSIATWAGRSSVWLKSRSSAKSWYCAAKGGGKHRSASPRYCKPWRGRQSATNSWRYYGLLIGREVVMEQGVVVRSNSGGTLPHARIHHGRRERRALHDPPSPLPCPGSATICSCGNADLIDILTHMTRWISVVTDIGPTHRTRQQSPHQTSMRFAHRWDPGVKPCAMI